MKYIPGFQFVAGSLQKKSISMMERTNQQKRAIADSDFIPGETYKIHNIKRDGNKFIYTFKAGSSNDLELEFESVEAAEQRISRLIGA